MTNDIQTYNQDESIVVYQSEDNALRLDVQFANETVWLTQEQISILFQKAKSTISYHISNIFKEGELDEKVVVRKIRITTPHGAIAGKTQTDELNLYNLDVIISVGYRVKSQRGVRFRQWANRILKEYLLHGYAFNQRFERIELRLANMEKRQSDFEMEIHTSLPPKEGIFVDGQIYDAFEFVNGLISGAEKSVVLIDNYVDESVLNLLTGKKSGVSVEIYTRPISKLFRQAADKFDAQYGGLMVNEINSVHDRFLIIDDQEIYFIGASLKDLGRKLFAFSKMETNQINVLKQYLAKK